MASPGAETLAQKYMLWHTNRKLRTILYWISPTGSYPRGCVLIEGCAIVFSKIPALTGFLFGRQIFQSLLSLCLNLREWIQWWRDVSSCQSKEDFSGVRNCSKCQRKKSVFWWFLMTIIFGPNKNSHVLSLILWIK